MKSRVTQLPSDGVCKGGVLVWDSEVSGRPGLHSMGVGDAVDVATDVVGDGVGAGSVGDSVAGPVPSAVWAGEGVFGTDEPPAVLVGFVSRTLGVGVGNSGAV